MVVVGLALVMVKQHHTYFGPTSCACWNQNGNVTQYFSRGSVNFNYLEVEFVTHFHLYQSAVKSKKKLLSLAVWKVSTQLNLLLF